MEIEVVFGKVLKEFRKERKLSQEELAFICGLDRTYISLMERGKRKPTITTIFVLAAGLEILPSLLVSKTEQKCGL
ncbi:helix-turn-helix transcriptional regulator [Aciduricibacillus chroicocephali]|uniref:Helix-turn-helix transcriptional regulator n=1 Tax=Aciduricibacillus chroicocephali TaxID=3054939 RepID=A0ABY9KUU0_9BACI|nr:helix-turn-helix transcriptional regulator [Bacillaceae bacterium 44XB]WLV25846.1 helix-turn-helix transcriptional regulator [Bacillaceae bacterium 44XB]